jgi:hypothetical protein
MESQLASARVLLMVAVVPIVVFLCLRAAGVDVGPALGGGPSMPSSDTQVVADFTASTTSADGLFDRRAGTRASVAFGGFAREPRSDEVRRRQGFVRRQGWRLRWRRRRG